MESKSTFLTTEFMATFAGGGVALERGFNDADPWVRVASILAFAAVACAYILSRTVVKSCAAPKTPREEIG